MEKITKEQVKFMYKHTYGNESIYFFSVDNGYLKLRYHVVANSKIKALKKLLNNDFVTFDYL